MYSWWILLKERFSPFLYIPMILVFTGANALYISKAANYTFDSGNFILAALLMFSFFFRMRCFDEIKDFEVDLRINPNRPLARGVLSVEQVKKGLLILIVLELALSAYLGFWPFVIHIIAIFYSLMMYEEFFIGEWIRPHLTTYALTHTFVSVLLGISAASAVTGFNIQKIASMDILFFLMNWMFFNLFEFARKTYAPFEERPTVPSYSKIFKPPGAWLLSWSQVLLGILLCYGSFGDVERFYWLVLAAILYTFLSFVYVLKPHPQVAKIFRGLTGIYLLVHYILIILVIGV